MTRDEIIRIAQEAGMLGLDADGRIERFAALVAAAERKRIESRPWGAGKEWIARAVEAEREACVKVVEQYTGAWDDGGYALAQAIRARGKK
jgi:hypothetical protein